MLGAVPTSQDEQHQHGAVGSSRGPECPSASPCATSSGLCSCQRSEEGDTAWEGDSVAWPEGRGLYGESAHPPSCTLGGEQHPLPYSPLPPGSWPSLHSWRETVQEKKKALTGPGSRSVAVAMQRCSRRRRKRREEGTCCATTETPQVLKCPWQVSAYSSRAVLGPHQG